MLRDHLPVKQLSSERSVYWYGMVNSFCPCAQGTFNKEMSSACRAGLLTWNVFENRGFIVWRRCRGLYSCSCWGVMMLERSWSESLPGASKFTYIDTD